MQLTDGTKMLQGLENSLRSSIMIRSLSTAPGFKFCRWHMSPTCSGQSRLCSPGNSPFYGRQGVWGPPRLLYLTSPGISQASSLCVWIFQEEKTLGSESMPPSVLGSPALTQCSERMRAVWSHSTTNHVGSSLGFSEL